MEFFINRLNTDFLLLKCLPAKRWELWTAITTNGFISKDDKTRCMDFYTKAHALNARFSKLAMIWRTWKAKQTITTDLYMNEININHRNSIKIHQNNTNYWFTVSDLINQIEASLLNSPYYFSEPLEPKNPYTNVPFTKATLYNIYFKIRESTYLPSVLIHNYFLCEFDLYLFRIENECLIRETYFRRYIYNTDPNTLFYEILDLTRTFRFRIDDSAPRDEIIKIMRPYLYLHMVSKYHICGLEKQAIAQVLLSDTMNALRLFNKQFGQKEIKKQNNILTGVMVTSVTYNLKHPLFTMRDAIGHSQDTI